MGLAESYYLEETYGGARKLGGEALADYGKAVLVVVSADGAVSDAEMRAWLGIARACGATDEQVRAWIELDWDNARLEDCIPGISSDPENPGEIALAFLYDAIRVSRADGVYAEKERDAVARAARTLGIPLAQVAALEALVDAEAALRSLRLSLFYPQNVRFSRGTQPSGLR